MHRISEHTVGILAILEPQIELAKNYKLSRQELNEIEKIIEIHYTEFIKAWEDHFGSRSN